MSHASPAALGSSRLPQLGVQPMVYLALKENAELQPFTLTL